MDHQASISRDDLECMLLDETSGPMALPLSLLEGITCGFSHQQEIGRGGFAVVYKGTLGNGLTVAVKRLSNTYTHEKEFQREVECLMKVKHNNIVRFMGYCVDTQGSAANFQGKFVIAEVQQRLLCFEYLPNGSLDKHIQDASSGLEWSKRYKIIMGICEGLRYLHKKNIVHLDLKPPNILMDANMMPKITDFGLSRCFEEKQTRVIATKIGGTWGYLAPEFNSHEITHKFDLYSLGAIIMEMLTGGKGHQAVEMILESWANRVDKSEGNAQFEQIQTCAEIAIECIQYDPEKRPASIEHIITRLEETQRTQVIPDSNELLEIYPLVLRFPFEPNKSIPCSLQLTNNTDKHTAFMLKNRSGNRCFARLPLYGVVPPRSTYTLVVITEKHDKPPEKKYVDLILNSSPTDDDHNWLSKRYEDGDFFVEANRMGNIVHEVALGAVCTPQRGTIVSKVSHVEIPYERVQSLDTHPTRQWIITSHDKGRIRIWNYETQRLVGSYKVSRRTVTSIKFIESKKWFVAVTEDGFIHVYNYDKVQRITCYRAHSEANHVISLVVHPTQPYILSLADNCKQAKLWDWNKVWECTRTFSMRYTSSQQFVFHPKDSNIFVSASYHTVKIWSLDSSESKYTLSGHSDTVNCMDFFTRDDHHYLITGSSDRTAKIWDMQKKTCVHTLEAFMSSVISVFSPPSLPILITSSKDGTIHLWSAANFRVERVLQVAYGRALCWMGPKRFVIDERYGDMSVMSIDNVNFQAESTVTTEEQRNVDSKPMITQANQVSSELLNVHRTSRLALQLTNNIDERVAFNLMSASGIVPPKCTCTLVAVDEGDRLIVQTSLFGDRYIVPFADIFESRKFFEEAKEMGNAVHEVILNTFDPKEETTTLEAIQPITKIIPVVGRHDFGRLCSLDAHPTESLILTGHNKGHFRNQIRLWSDDLEADMLASTVCEFPAYSVKFIAQKQWFISGSCDGFIHVYNYENKIQEIKRFKAHDESVISLAVHPTQSYVMSESHPGWIKLWDWNNGWPNFIQKYTGWKCIQIFEDGDPCFVKPFAFNPKETNSIAGASYDHTIKVWNIDTPGSKYTLSGHSDVVNCLDFFTRDDQQYLITGSDDCTAKIWDLQKKTCVHTLDTFMSPVVSVISLLDRPYIILASKDGILYIWSCTSFRLERMVTFGRTGVVPRLWLMGMRRILIEQEGRLSVIDIDNEKEVH